MYERVKQTKFGEVRYAVADEGNKILVCQGILVDEVAMGMYAQLEDFTEVEDSEYVPSVDIPTEDLVLQLSQLQENQIQLSKKNLSEYLSSNPLFSKVHKEDGAYYSVTSTKQQQLTSKLLIYQVYAGQGLPYTLTWNDTGNVCEEWTYPELLQLSMEIDAYITPLVGLQQHIEVDIKNATTQDEVLDVNVEFTKDVVENWMLKYIGE